MAAGGCPARPEAGAELRPAAVGLAGDALVRAKSALLRKRAGAGRLSGAQSPHVRWPATDLGPPSRGIQRSRPARASRYGEETSPAPDTSNRPWWLLNLPLLSP